MSTTVPETGFYVYILARPDGRPFYVGKGMAYRLYDHATEAKSDCRCHKCRLIRKIWRNGGQVQHYIIFTTEDEQEALEHEKAMIAFYGRESLVNKTDGGEGVNSASPEFRRNRGIAIRKAKATPEAKERASQASKKIWSDPDRLERYRAKIKAKWQDPEFRERHRQAMLKSINPDVVNRRSEAIKKRWQDPGYRAKQAAIKSDPQIKERISNKIKQLWQDPEYRQHQIDITKKTRAKAKEKGQKNDPNSSG